MLNFIKIEAFLAFHYTADLTHLNQYSHISFVNRCFTWKSFLHSAIIWASPWVAARFSFRSFWSGLPRLGFLCITLQREKSTYTNPVIWCRARDMFGKKTVWFPNLLVDLEQCCLVPNTGMVLPTSLPTLCKLFLWNSLPPPWFFFLISLFIL